MDLATKEFVEKNEGREDAFDWLAFKYKQLIERLTAEFGTKWTKSGILDYEMEGNNDEDLKGFSKFIGSCMKNSENYHKSINRAIKPDDTKGNATDGEKTWDLKDDSGLGIRESRKVPVKSVPNKAKTVKKAK